jgi:peptidyl-tRNA hydrolase
MSPAYQAVQSGHAAIQFQYDYPSIAKEWHDNSKYLIYLSVENEFELQKLIHKLQKSNIKYSIFRESDIDNQITAIAIEPSDKTRKLVSSLPLMLKEYNLFNKIDKNSYKEKEESYV